MNDTDCERNKSPRERSSGRRETNERCNSRILQNLDNNNKHIENLSIGQFQSEEGPQISCAGKVAINFLFRNRVTNFQTVDSLLAVVHYANIGYC